MQVNRILLNLFSLVFANDVDPLNFKRPGSFERSAYVKPSYYPPCRQVSPKRGIFRKQGQFFLFGSLVCFWAINSFKWFVTRVLRSKSINMISTIRMRSSVQNFATKQSTPNYATKRWLICKFGIHIANNFNDLQTSSSVAEVLYVKTEQEQQCRTLRSRF